MEGLKILTIEKKPKQNPWINGYPAALIAVVGWLGFPIENKPPNVFFLPLRKQDVISCPPARDRVIPNPPRGRICRWDAGEEGGDGKGGGVSLGRTIFSEMPEAGRKKTLIL